MWLDIPYLDSMGWISYNPKDFSFPNRVFSPPGVPMVDLLCIHWPVWRNWRIEVWDFKCTWMGWFITAVGVHVFFLNVYSEIEYPVLWKWYSFFKYVVEKKVWMIGSSLLNYFL